MINIKEPKAWLLIAFMILLLVWMFVIIRKHHEQNDLQGKIYNHSEIVDTI
jgi:preprotein translocase subunit YajC